MKNLDPASFDLGACRTQVEEFRAWLSEKDELSERGDVLPFFRARTQMSLLFGSFNPRMARADRIAPEFDIFGDFGKG